MSTPPIGQQGDPAGQTGTQTAQTAQMPWQQANGTTASTTAPPAGQQQAGDEPLGEAGIKALQTERDARKALEDQIKALQTSQADQMAKLAEAFGLKPKEAAQGDVVATLQQQMATLQHQNLVYQVAGEHGITDKDDLALLGAAVREDTMRQLAARLKPAEAPPAAQQPRTPRPDPTQGHGANQQTGGKAAGLAEAERRFGKKQ